MIALIIIGYLIGIFFPMTLVAVAIFYIGRLLIKFYDWL